MTEGKSIRHYYLVTSQNFPDGGAGASYLNLFCHGLQKKGCQVSVFLLKGHAFGDFKYEGPRKNSTSYGVPYTYLGFTRRPDNQLLKISEEFLSFFRLLGFLITLSGRKKTATLLVFNSEIQSNIPIFTLSRLFGINTVKFVAEHIDKSQFRGSFFRRLKWYGYRFNFRYLNKLAGKLIVFSYYLRDEFVKMGFPESRIIIQPNLTDFEFWEPNGSPARFTLGYSGAPYLKDGLNDLFKAISILKDKDIFVNLIVIGDAVFGKSLIPGLKDECVKLGISDRISFTGLVNTPTVKKFLCESRFLAITRPSTVQTLAGFPTKLGEYFGTRKPVLATNFGDIPKYFESGTDIVIAETDNPESIASGIEWMLENEDALNTITQNGYDKAKKLLDYSTAIERIIRFMN